MHLSIEKNKLNYFFNREAREQKLSIKRAKYYERLQEAKKNEYLR